jgi:hypothetical protein
MKLEIPESTRNFLFQLTTITAGVLIALFLEGLVGWSDNRALVREARAMIAQEIAENKKELGGSLAELDARGNNLETALRFANELLEYDEVRRYSRLYALQEVFTAHQQRALDRMSGALAIISAGDPHKATPKDLEAFRQHIMALRGDLLIDHDLGKALSSAYDSELRR